MLDYKKLSDEFSVKLQQFDKEFLETWIAFDQQREFFNKVKCQETAVFTSRVVKTLKVSDKSFVTNDMSNNFAMAA